MFTFGPIPRIYPIAPSGIRLGAMGAAVPKPVDLTGTLTVLVPGEPVAQPRHRSAIAYMKGKPTVRLYIPSDHPVHGYKDDVRKAVRLVRPSGWNKSGPVAVGCLFVFGRIQALPKRGGRVPKDTKPDTDNVLKAVWDACTGEIWEDDSQVSAVQAVKLWGAPHDEPHTVLVFDPSPAAILSGEWTRRTAAALARI